MNARQAEELAAGSKTRITGETEEQTIKATAGVLHRIVVANTDAAAQTLTVTEGEDDLIVIAVAADASVSLEFNLAMASIKVTPSDALIDALVIFD